MTHPALHPGRTAIITGAASGIGRAAARALAAQGMAVALIDLPGPALQDTAAEMQALGAQALALPADVADRAALQAAADRIGAELPPVTLVMNNAGRGEPSSCLGDPGPFTRTLDANLWGIIHGTQVFAPLVLSHGQPGAIINTGSKQGITTPPGNPAYNVSKAGVKAFTEALAHELRNIAGSKVTAHLLIPGWVHTGLTAASGTPKPAGAWSAEADGRFPVGQPRARRFLHPVPRQRHPPRLGRKAHRLGGGRHHREPPRPVALASRLGGKVQGSTGIKRRKRLSDTGATGPDQDPADWIA